MSKKGRTAKVKEPIQVYLAPEDRALLDGAARVSGMSRAEVLRRGIRAVSGELMGDEHPAIKHMRKMNAIMADDSRPPQPPVSDDEYQKRLDDELIETYLETHEPESK